MLLVRQRGPGHALGERRALRGRALRDAGARRAPPPRRRGQGACGRLRRGDPLLRPRRAEPLTDIGALQAAAPPGSLFQVASQFNCLEAPDACIVDVADYFHDPTQGPRASISAFPGTLLRHYAAPGSREQSGARFVQREEGPQLNLLSAVCEAGTAEVRCGYLLTSNILRPDRFAALLTERADELRVGLHDGVEVVLGGDWDRAVLASPRPRIAQVFTSSVAAGGYSALDTRDPSFGAIVRGLQRAAHEGALLAAASIGASFAVMTLIGGGVFGNPVPLVYRSILAAIDAVRPLLHRDLTVVLNGFSIGQRVPHAELKKDAETRGGRLLVFTPDSVNAA
ncbi:MAG: hypothetical protein U0359_04000 [Byssovorax sp.]